MQPLPTVPLTPDEKEHLLFIYRSRLRFFTSVYLCLILVVGAYSIRATLKPSGKLDRKGYDYLLTDTWQMYLINFTALGGATIIPGIFIFKRRINSYRKDIKRGVVELVPFQITNKLYFEHTSQYFLSLNHPKYMHYETTQEFYTSCDIGDELIVKRAPHSKHMFDNRASFSII